MRRAWPVRCVRVPTQKGLPERRSGPQVLDTQEREKSKAWEAAPACHRSYIHLCPIFACTLAFLPVSPANTLSHTYHQGMTAEISLWIFQVPLENYNRESEVPIRPALLLETNDTVYYLLVNFH
ncbi:hypothetical protein CB1_001499011 [Camelus ferus]|nr:hypothetical protein CB1_001499011 [Camelus ferus]